jgi:hypothetical protein
VGNRATDRESAAQILGQSAENESRIRFIPHHDLVINYISQPVAARYSPGLHVGVM